MSQLTCDLVGDHCENPLLANLPASMGFAEWSALIRHDPRANWQKPPHPGEREDRAMEIGALVAPLFATIDIARTLSRMLRHELTARDPRIEANRRSFFEMAKWKSSTIKDLPWFPSSAGGAMIRGPTGVGKSHALEAFLRRVPNVLTRPAVPGAWLELKHLIYLKVPMPSDGSRGGLLMGITVAMDNELGTMYIAEFKALRTIEKQLVMVLHWLMLHRCGMLIIEEAQEKNLQTNVLGPEFVQFFLRVMNYGVPLVLIGNPLAFEEVDRNSQTKRRLSFYGSFELMPVADPKSKTWTQDVMPHIWGWSVLEEPDEEFEHRDEYVWKLTGGIQEMVSRLRRQTLIAAIEDNASSVCVRHIERAFKSPAMCAMHDVIRGYTQKDLRLLALIVDQPVDYLRRKWGTAVPAEDPPVTESLSSNEATRPSDTVESRAKKSEKCADDTLAASRPIAPQGGTGVVAHDESQGSSTLEAKGTDGIDRRSSEFLDSLRRT